MRKQVIGVMGAGEGATPIDCQIAYELGKLIAQHNWVLLTGGRNVGVMDAASRGAKQAGGLTIGILPTPDDRHLSDAVDIAILTDMGNARNNINVLSSHAIVACGMGAGTASEIALAIKAGKPVILLNPDIKTQQFFVQLAPEQVTIAANPQAVVDRLRQLLSS